jgi:cytochrome P450
MHPEVLEKLCAEHDRVFGTTAPEALMFLETTPSKTNELEYTNAVIKETLRLFNVGLSVRSPPDGV